MAQQQRISAFNALRQFTIEGQAFVIEHPSSNMLDFVEWVKSYPASTNKSAAELTSTCEAVWVNNSIKSWLVPSNTGSNKIATAMVGQYQCGGRRYLIGITFTGDAVERNAPPESGFTKLDLRGVR